MTTERVNGPLAEQHGSAARPDRPPAHARPDGVSDATVGALGKLSEALEMVEHARGLLYGFHRLSGSADLALREAVGLLRDAGHGELADDVDRTLVGRDTVDGMWTFQLVESYDAQYWTAFRQVEEHARMQLGVAVPHLYEAEMKHQEQSGGRPE
ncbi:MAG: hypothetical protein M3Y77_09375 [Actinomycetota bacterium]|nr:hypothetical protein [Actinomycetota bacterium]